MPSRQGLATPAGLPASNRCTCCLRNRLRRLLLIQILLFATALLPAVRANEAASEQEKADAANAIQKYLSVGRKNVVRSATMAARFAGKLPKLGREATIVAKKTILPNGAVEYDVVDREGDRTVQKDLIARYMGAEIESSSKPSDEMAINEKNYKIKSKGLQQRDGRSVQVLELNPRKKRPGLWKGEVWVDPESGLTICESGRFVKSPSVFLKKVEFERYYTIEQGQSVPRLMVTSIQTRFWGIAELRVEYSDLQLEPPAGHNHVANTSAEASKPQEAPPPYLAN